MIYDDVELTQDVAARAYQLEVDQHVGGYRNLALHRALVYIVPNKRDAVPDRVDGP